MASRAASRLQHFNNLTHASHTNILTANSLVGVTSGSTPLKRCPSFTWCFLLLPRPHPGHPLVSAAALNRKACSEKRVTVIRRRPSNGLLGVASAFPAPRANRTERYLCTRLEFTGAAADTIISSTSRSIGPAKVNNNQSSRGTQQEKK